MPEPAEPGPAAPPQPSIWIILTPKWRSILARLKQEQSGVSTKILLLTLVGAGFWSGLFAFVYRLLKYARNAPEIGALLPGKLLGLALAAFGSILLLSNLITALSTFFLAKDLDTLVASPVDWLRLYLAKLSETMVHSSWMVALLALPIFTAYGIVYHGGPFFPLVAIGAFLPFIVLPAVLGAALTLLLVSLFPARRTRDLLALVAAGAAGTIVIMIRFVQPEQYARPEGFQNLVEFLSILRTPTNPLLPSEWSAAMIMNWLERVGDPLPIALLWTTAGAFVVLGALLHLGLYDRAYSKAQEGAERAAAPTAVSRALIRPFKILPAGKREFVLKDLRLFFRDSTQWSQLILLAVLLIVYLFNIRTLPLFTGERVSFVLVTAIVFLNLGLAGFVLAAVAARFTFPAVSLEGKQMWLLRSSPLDLTTLLWSKYWTGTVPLLGVALLIVTVTNYLLQASAFMMALSIATIVLFTLAASAMALTFGAYYPLFDAANAAQIPTSFGGLIFMMTSISLLVIVIAIEAVPVTSYLRVEQTGADAPVTTELVLALGAVAVICIGATLTSLRLGLRRMEQMEW